MSLTVDRSYAGVDLGVSIENGKLKGFYLAVKDYYKVPEQDIRVVREKRIPDEEMPVVFFLAKKASADPSRIIALRLQGKSWMEITLHFGLGPEVYYVPVKKEVSGPPYGKAYGHFKNKHGKGGPPWKRDESRGPSGAELGDDDVVNLVNLKFISEHYKLQPEEVIDMRSKGKNFISINAEINGGKKSIEVKAGSTEAAKRSERDGENYADEGDNGKGRGKGKGHGKWN